MHSLRRIFSVGTAALMLEAGLVAGSSGAAQAAVSDCTEGRAGFTDIPDSLSGRGVAGGALVVDFPTNVPYAVASYAMQTGNVGGREMGRGVLSTGASIGSPVPPERSGWMSPTTTSSRGSSAARSTCRRPSAGNPHVSEQANDVYGNAADHPVRVRRYPSDMTDAEWAADRPLLPVPAWLQRRGGRP
ncbi:transposase [Streptomyces phaeochromogenes]|uniref:hypothetical protein n=1 Tax=Streptomyces phaeochromogenes TaxID=1923 RepID=UPI0033E24F05